MNDNKDRSSLFKGGNANLLFVFARWQHRTDGLAVLHVLAGGSAPNLPVAPQVYLRNGI